MYDSTAGVPSIARLIGEASMKLPLKLCVVTWFPFTEVHAQTAQLAQNDQAQTKRPFPFRIVTFTAVARLRGIAMKKKGLAYAVAASDQLKRNE